jgi:cytochrome c oxidase subunit 2
VAASPSGDGLVRWLIGGLVVGAIVLGLLVGAYEIGYHRGHQAAGTTTSLPTTAPATTTTAPATTAGPAGAAAARGQQLYTADACSSCHSLTGTNGVGPTFKGLAGSTVTLSDGSTVTANDAYLAKSITDPDAEIVKGFQKGVMPAAIASFGLAQKPQDVAALVAFIKAQR